MFAASCTYIDIKLQAAARGNNLLFLLPHVRAPVVFIAFEAGNGPISSWAAFVRLIGGFGRLFGLEHASRFALFVEIHFDGVPRFFLTVGPYVALGASLILVWFGVYFCLLFF